MAEVNLSTIGEERLKALLKAAFVEVLEERRDLVLDVMEEALEDIALGRAIQEAEGSEMVGEDSILAILHETD
ncbi:MAG TPA: hypothetical protein VEL74_13925 [Thermoanaerobaculia bacterium]|nr:hypothetical protein [Thermoanaerobaculia bacterium]